MAMLAVSSTACTADPQVSTAIRGLIEDRQADTIRLADATRFAWDGAYLFGPYAPRAQVCATLRIPDADCARLVPFESVDDGEMSIAFLAQGRLVHYARHRRANGDFTPVPTGPLAPDGAVFRVVGDAAAAGGTRLVSR